MSKTVLITGGAGFVGSNLTLFLQSQLEGFKFICFDNLIRPGSEMNVKRLEDSGVTFVQGDVRDKEQLLALPKIDLILECSADPSVLASIENPQYTIDTNLIGTIHCLELAKRDSSDFIFLSTSRVYPIDALNAVSYEELPTRFDWIRGSQGKGVSFEGVGLDFPTSGVRSLYGATKLCSEHLIQEYLELYSLRGVINRCGVIGGPWQMGKIDQGIIGFWVMQHLFERPLSYIGFGGGGKQVRDIVHIDDVCDLILFQIRNFQEVDREIYNVGGGRRNSVSLVELTELVRQCHGKKKEIRSVLEDRKADVRVYITDHSYVTGCTGWSPKRTVEDIVRDTWAWACEHRSSLERILT